MSRSQSASASVGSGRSGCQALGGYCGDEHRTELATFINDLQEVRQVVQGRRGHQEVVEDQHAGELQAFHDFEELPGAARGGECGISRK